MATDTKDVLTRLQQARAQSQSSTSLFFFLKAGEKAMLRCLRDFDQMVAISSHRRYDEATRRYDHAVCAKEYGHECEVCEAYNANKSDWKLKPRDLFYLPIYLHKKITADKQTREVGQMLYLEMSSMDGILAGLGSLFFSEDNVKGDITNADLVIERIGEGAQSKYTVVARRTQPAPLPADLVIPTEEKIKSDVESQHPIRIIETDDAPSPNPDIIAADPFKTVDEFDGF